MKKKCKFKVGDMVINNSFNGYSHTGIGFIGEVVKVFPNGYIGVRGKSVNTLPFLNDVGVGEWTVNSTAFDLYTPHEGKILIMVDEKDNNKIIARDLLTNKTAEAKCNPKDEWDFNKGAKLALERLIGSEKPKKWTGKVVCITTTHHCFSCGNDMFTVGKVYTVQDGVIYGDNGTVYTGIHPICDVNDLINGRKDYCPIFCKFIEYKGGAEE